jgi:hypothetical protein
VAVDVNGLSGTFSGCEPTLLLLAGRTVGLSFPPDF